MADLDTFLAEYPPDADRERPRRATLASLARAVPSELPAFLQRVGFGSFGGGLVWTVDPGPLDAPLAEWLPAKKGRPRAIAVVRTAFGKVIAWHDRHFVLLDVHHGDRFDAGDDVQVLFDVFLVGPEARRSILQAPLVAKARKKLGPLSPHQMYAFGLPLALGGDRGVKNLVKVAMAEQLSVLAQALRPAR